jgi:hypothetical protein
MAIGVEWKHRVAARGTAGRMDPNVREANLAEVASREERAIVKDMSNWIRGYVSDVV